MLSLASREPIIVASWGINVDAPAALKAVATTYDLKPAMIGEIDPETPVDLRRLPSLLKEQQQ